MSFIVGTWAPIAPQGEIWGFGNNVNGALGDGTTTSASSPVQTVSGGHDWVHLDASNFSSGIKTDGTLWMWGVNSNGQLGVGDTIFRSSPTQVMVGTTDWKHVATGTFHTLAVKNNGTLWAWGWNAQGQLGDNTVASKSTPIQVGASNDWAYAIGGFDFSAAVKKNGTLWLWGNNSTGQLGDGTITPRSSPVQIISEGFWKSVSLTRAGFEHAAAGVKTDGTLWTWGDNYNGQLGDGTITPRSSPVQIAGGGTDWRQVSCGQHGMAATKADSTLWGWGDNYNGQLGLPGGEGVMSYSSPIQLYGTNWRSVSFGSLYHCSALKNDGTIWTWGDGYAGQLGTTAGIGEYRLIPSQVNIEGTFRSLVAGEQLTLAIRDVFVTPATALDANQSVLWSWGENTYRQAGLDSYSLINAIHDPVQPSVTGTNWKQLAGGYYHTLGVKHDGTLWSWGSPNFDGQLGQGDTAGRNVPTQVGSSGDWDSVAAGMQQSYAIKKDGTLWSCGHNVYGGLGDGTSISKSSFVQVGADTTWKQVAAHMWRGMATAIKTDGTLWAWGYNGDPSYGSLGIDSVESSVSSPMQVIGGGTNWKHVSCGYGFWMATKTDGTLWACGYNYDAQLGNGDVLLAGAFTPIQVGAGLNTWKDVTCGVASTAAISTDNRLWTWGSNWWGELGTGDTARYVDPQEPVPSVTNWKSVGCGYGLTVGVTTDGKMYGAGINTAGQLSIDPNVTDHSNTFIEIPEFSGTWKDVSCAYGTVYGYSTTVSTATPSEQLTGGSRLKIVSTNSNYQVGNGTNASGVAVYQEPVSSDQKWKQVAFSSVESVNALKEDGSLWAWGAYNVGGTTNSTPVQVSTNGTGYSRIVLGVYHGLGLKTDGTLWTWGQNNYGQTAQSSTSTVLNYPAQIGTESNWSYVAAGDYTSAGIKTDGTLWMWGMNTGYQAGNETNINYSSPVQVAGGGTNWTKVACGYRHSIGLKSDGSVWLWGTDSVGEMAANVPGIVFKSPTNINGRTNTWTSLAMGSQASHVVGINSNNTLWTWGQNTFGALGNNTTVNKNIPTLTVFGGTNWTSLYLGQRHTAGVKSDGTLWTWGYNVMGQLGTNDRTNRSSAVQTVASGTTWAKVACGYSVTLATKTDGTLWAWGQNTDGTLGTGDRVNRSSPVQTIAAGTAWVTPVSGAWHAGAIKSDGTLWLWGRGTSGQMGDGTAVSKSSPVQTIAGGTNWASVAMGTDFTAAIKSDGTLWTWGFNTYGQLGDGTNISKSSPVQTITGGNTWASVACGEYFTVAKKTDGTVWTWGRNDNGQLAVNDRVNRSSPIQTVAGGTDWVSVVAGQTHAAGIKTDGTIWTWGSNLAGQLGNGDTTNYVKVSSPIQVIGTYAGTWKDVQAYWNYASAIKADGTLWSWGSANNGYLGIPPIFYFQQDNKKSSPVQVVTGGNNWKSFADGPALAYRVNGTLWGWGHVNHKAYSNSGTTDADYYTKHFPQLITGEYTVVQAATSNGVSFGEVVRDISGAAYGWGDNTHGKLGVGTVSAVAVPTQIPDDSSNGWKHISVGADHTLAISTDGTLWAWGSNLQGQLGVGTFDSGTTAPQLVNAGTTWTRVEAGRQTSFAAKSDGTLWSWGDGASGTLGQSSTLAIATPTQVLPGPATRIIPYGSSGVSLTSMRVHEDTWIDISSQGKHTVGIKANCTVWLWGDNTYGQLGDNTITPSTSPIQEVGKHGAWASISAGENHTAAIKGDGTLWTWGRNAYGQLGDNTTGSKSSPVQTVAGGSTWKYVACGYDHTVAMKTDGTIWTWGRNHKGQLGNGTIIDVSSPVQVITGGTGWIAVYAGGNRSAAFDTLRDSVWAWGEVSDPTTLSDTSIPTQTQAGNNAWSYVSVGGNGVIALQDLYSEPVDAVLLEGTPEQIYYPPTPSAGYDMADLLVKRWIFSDGNMWAWGLNDVGQIGDLSIVPKSSPVQVTGGSSWKQVAASQGHAVGIKTDGTLWGWGSGGFGRLGNNNGTAQVSSPVQTVAGGNNWVQVSCGSSFTGAIKADGTLWLWGLNGSGYLGTGNTVSRSSPVQTTVGGNSWKQVSCGNIHTSAIKTDGTLWTWGSNTRGQLGTGNGLPRSMPAQTIVGGNDWLAVTGGVDHTVAIKKDGSLWGWGDDTYGQLGRGITESAVLSPIQLTAAGTGWKMIDAGDKCTVGIKTDGTLWVTGRNEYGQIGAGSVSGVSSFTQLTAGTLPWKYVEVGMDNIVAVRVDGTLWAAGYNNYGQIGDGTQSNVSVLTQVGSDANWKQATINLWTMYGVKDEVG